MMIPAFAVPLSLILHALSLRQLRRWRISAEGMDPAQGFRQIGAGPAS